MVKKHNKLVVELWQEIFLHLDYGSLFSTLLVSRKFCNMVIPILWRNTWDVSLIKLVKLIRTYFSNLNEDSRSLLVEKGIDLTSSPFGTSFDYSSLLKHLNIPLLEFGVEYYAKKKKLNNDHKCIILKELFKLFLTHSNILSLNLTLDSRWDLNQEILISCRNSQEKIPSLSGLKFLIGHDLSNSPMNLNRFTDEITNNSVGIVRIEMILKSFKEGIFFSNLVQAQNNLKELTIVSSNNYYVPVLTGISTQSCSLVRLKLTGINFIYFDDKLLESLVSCKNLKNLELEYCFLRSGLGNLASENLNLNSFSTAFSQLEILKVFVDYHDSCHEDAILGFIKTSNKNLKRISILKPLPNVNKICYFIAENCVNLQYLKIGNSEFNSISSLKSFLKSNKKKFKNWGLEIM